MHDYLHPVMADHAGHLIGLSFGSIGLAGSLALAGLAMLVLMSIWIAVRVGAGAASRRRSGER